MIFEADNKVLRQQKVQFNVVPLKFPKLSNAKHYYFGLLHILDTIIIDFLHPSFPL